MNPKNLVCTWYILIRFESFKFEKKPGKFFFFSKEEKADVVSTKLKLLGFVCVTDGIS